MFWGKNYDLNWYSLADIKKILNRKQEKKARIIVWFFRRRRMAGDSARRAKRGWSVRGWVKNPHPCGFLTLEFSLRENSTRNIEQRHPCRRLCADGRVETAPLSRQVDAWSFAVWQNSGAVRRIAGQPNSPPFLMLQNSLAGSFRLSVSIKTCLSFDFLR